MAFAAGGQDFASTARHVALGKTADRCRWVGGEAAAIDKDLIRTCTENSEAGKILDLNFHFKFVDQVSGLEAYATSLRNLDLSYNNLRQIEGLKGMSRLRELKLYGCQISHISGLESCASLLSLHLDDNCISSVEGLDSLKLLEYLNLDSNKVQRLGKNLARLPKLRELHVSQNRLSSLDGLAGMGALEVFSACRNQIREITSEQVKGLNKLDEMRLEGNQLRSLSFLVGGSGSSQPLPSLATLDVSSNSISAEALVGLPPLTQLVEVNLAGNRITDLPTSIASSWRSVEILDLSRNQVEYTAQLEQLKEFISLRELSLQGNPVTSREDEDILKLLGAVEGLEYLDDKPVPVLQAPAPTGTGDEDTEEKTFVLTTARGTAGGSRPSTASRPSTSSSRPGTAQGMREAGKEPLMHAQIKLSERRFASEEQVSAWEKQTMDSLAAIEKQINRVALLADKELAHMDRCVQKAQRVVQRQKELQAQGKWPPLDEETADEDSRLPTPSLIVESLAGSAPPSRLGSRLREVVNSAREDCEDARAQAGDFASTGSSAVPQPETPKTPQRKEAPPLPAACDEEILEEPPACSPLSGFGTDAEEDEPMQVATEDEPDTPAALPQRVRPKAAARGGATQASQVDLRVNLRAGSRRTRRSVAGAGGGASRKPPLARLPVR